MTKVTVKSYENGFGVIRGFGYAQNTHEYYRIYKASPGFGRRKSWGYAVLHLLEDNEVQEPVMFELSEELAWGRARFEAFACANKILENGWIKGTLVDKTKGFGLLAENQLKKDLGIVVDGGKGIIET